MTRRRIAVAAGLLVLLAIATTFWRSRAFPLPPPIGGGIEVLRAVAGRPTVVAKPVPVEGLARADPPSITRLKPGTVPGPFVTFSGGQRAVQMPISPVARDIPQLEAADLGTTGAALLLLPSPTTRPVDVSRLDVDPTVFYVGIDGRLSHIAAAARTQPFAGELPPYQIAVVARPDRPYLDSIAVGDRLSLSAEPAARQTGTPPAPPAYPVPGQAPSAPRPTAAPAYPAP